MRYQGHIRLLYENLVMYGEVFMVHTLWDVDFRNILLAFSPKLVPSVSQVTL